MELRLIPLSCEPEIRIVPAPSFDSDVLTQVVEARTKLLAHPNGFDGPQLMGVGIGGHVIEAWEATYSFYRAHRHSGFSDTFGLGALGVGVLIFDQHGRQLWHRRSDQMATDPGLWCYGVAGGIQPQMIPRQTALEELREELRLCADDLVELRPLALVSGGEAGVYPMYAATLKHGVTLVAEPSEIAELRWVEKPLAELEPVLPVVAKIYRLLLEHRLVVEKDGLAKAAPLRSKRWAAHPPTSPLSPPLPPGAAI